MSAPNDEKPSSSPSSPSPTSPPIHRRATIERSSQIPQPDIVSYFDPASIGGGGPLTRISTQQRERAEAEARERAARIAAGLPPDEGLFGLGRLKGRSASMSNANAAYRSRPMMTPITPLLSNKDTKPQPSAEVESKPVLHTLSTHWSSNTLADLDTTISKDKDRISNDHHGEEDDGDIEKKAKAVQLEGAHDQEIDHDAIAALYPDGGYGWVVLVCCITLAALTMGWGMVLGVILAYVSENIFPTTSSVYLSTAFTLAPLSGAISSYLGGRFGDRFGFKRILLASALCSWLGLFCAGFATEVWQMLITFGLIQGIGMGLAMPLFMSLPSQWFYRKRGFASGAAIGGAGLGGGFSCIIARQMLVSIGYKKTCIILSFVNLTVTLVAISLVRTRSCPETQRKGGSPPWFDPVVCRTGRFWAIWLSLVVAVLGYAMPFTWLPQFVSHSFPSISPTLQALPSTLMGFSVCIGRALAGAAADRFGPLNTYTTVFCLTGVITLSLWLTADSFGHTCAFAVLFGIVSPGFLGMVPQIVVTIFGPSNLATNVGLLLLATAPANFAAGPLGGKLYDMTGRESFKCVIVVGGLASFGGCALAVYGQYSLP